ncbi:glycosyltransferase [Candidatus Fermentibacteria bacterium]|nr:glycosyltransferase [Candidatus Fermentibacteria bacterium]
MGAYETRSPGHQYSSGHDRSFRLLGYLRLVDHPCSAAVQRASAAQDTQRHTWLYSPVHHPSRSGLEAVGGYIGKRRSERTWVEETMADFEELSILTVSHNSAGALAEWLRAWGGYGAQLVVADNGSTDSSQDLARAAGAKVVDSGGNPGFAAGVNRAASNSRGRRLLVCNPDAVPFDDRSLESLLSAQGPGRLVGGQLVDRSGRHLPSGGRWPDPGWVASQVFGPAGSLWSDGGVDWVQGAVMAMNRKDLLERLGGVCEEYPLYFEDVDLCHRAREMGMEVALNQEARFVHAEGSGSPGYRRSRLAAYHWGLYLFFARRAPAEAGRVRRLLLVKCVLRMLVSPLMARGSFTGYLDAFESLLSLKRPVLD